MKLCKKYQSTEPSIAKTLWENVAKKQKEWTHVVAHEFAEPGRNFCFNSPEEAKEKFKAYAKKRSLVFFDQDITKKNALIFPLDEKYKSPDSAIVKGSRFPEPVLGKVIFGSLTPGSADWLSPQDFCEIDCMASEAIFEARKEGLEEIRANLDAKIASLTPSP